jgi:hypothetical protein
MSVAETEREIGGLSCFGCDRRDGLPPRRISPAPMMIKADDRVRQAGPPHPPLTASDSGFVNRDGPSSQTGPPPLATAVDTGRPAATDPITIGGASAPKNRNTYVAGMLDVTPAATLPVSMIGVLNVTHKKYLVTEVIVTFSGTLETAKAQNPGIYACPCLAGRARARPGMVA